MTIKYLALLVSVTTALLGCEAKQTRTNIMWVDVLPSKELPEKMESSRMRLSDGTLRIIRGFDDNDINVDLQQVAFDNWYLTTYIRQHEYPFYNSGGRTFDSPKGKTLPLHLPKNCVALSGGGMRSAAFSIGVLRALHYYGYLRKVDVISAVSGGSYAATWFYGQQSIHNIDVDELFSHKTDYVERASQNARLVSPSTITSEILTELLSLVLLAPLNHLIVQLNKSEVGQFNVATKLNIGHRAKFYENNLRRVFLDENNVSFDEILKVADTNELPYLVYNVTAKEILNRGPNTLRTIEWGEDSVFEVTPHRYGGERTGYRYDKWPTDVSGAAALSGAAISEYHLKGSEVLRAFRAGLGGYLLFSPTASKDILYRFSQKGSDDSIETLTNRSVMLYLADGGFSDNLGAFSLVKRFCENIIIVDAEYDPELEFEGYRVLQEELLKDGITFNVPMIESILSIKNGDERRPTAFNMESPVMKGRVGPIPMIASIRENNPSEPISSSNPAKLYKKMLDANIIYIKLSIENQKLTQYSPIVQSYYSKNSPIACDPEKPNETNCNAFPQQSTLDQDFDEHQFRAYQELAEDIIKNNLK